MQEEEEFEEETIFSIGEEEEAGSIEEITAEPKRETPEQKKHYVYKQRILDYLHKKGFKVSSKIFDRIDKEIEEMLDKAVRRAKEEKKKTILPRHI